MSVMGAELDDWKVSLFSDLTIDNQNTRRKRFHERGFLLQITGPLNRFTIKQINTKMYVETHRQQWE